MENPTMDRLADPQQVARQYRDASNLDARAQLHDRFSTNKLGWHRWVFDRFRCPADSRILELGCGAGLLWTRNRERIPSGWDLVLSDLSPGMLDEARKRLGDTHAPLRLELINAQSIPYADGARLRAGAGLQSGERRGRTWAVFRRSGTASV
jgi:ubiquinone/menaquinone biosynthesis C-methylase UbiE